MLRISYLLYHEFAPLNVDAKGGQGRMNQDILPTLNAQRGTCWTLPMSIRAASLPFFDWHHSASGVTSR